LTRWFENRDSKSTAGMRHQLTRAPRPDSGQTLDQTRELIVRNRDQDQLRDFADVRGRNDVGARQQRLGPRTRSIRDSGRRNDTMSGSGERSPEDSAHTSASDHADIKSP
jgi:hypothetical protein